MGKNEFNEYLNSQPLEKLQEEAEIQARKDEEEFRQFSDAIAKGDCSYCGHPLTYFSEDEPCFHWLVWKATGLKKKHFPLLLQTTSFHQIDAYLRWVANSEVPMTNINDLVENKESNKIIETTIKYQNREWSFSCTQNDFAGHKDAHEGADPHYHFQMKIDGNVVISYNGFHLPFKGSDQFWFAIKQGDFDRLKSEQRFDAGMQAMFDNFTAEELLNEMATTEEHESAPFSMSTMIVADEGKTISGDEIANLFKESTETGIPIAKLIQNLKSVKAQTFIEPGPGVPELAKRTKHNRGKGSKDAE